MMILPDSSVLIPYFVRNSYVDRIEGALRAGRLALCSVVATEIMAGAFDQEDRQLYAGFVDRTRRSGLVVTPGDEEWQTCGRLLSRYRERFGDIRVRDHQNDALIVLTARRLARDTETTILTENERHLHTWLSFIHNHAGLRIEAMRR